MHDIPTSELNIASDLDKYARRYLKKMWVSKGCRFIAHRRLRERNHASQLVISLFSIGVIAASISLLVVSPDSKKLSDFISILAINASIFILVLSNLEFAKNYSVEAERMLRGAQLLSKMHDDLELNINQGSIAKETLALIIEHYNQVLMDFEVNHEEIDYRYFQVNHPSYFDLEKRGLTKRIFYRFEYFWHIWGPYSMCIVVPPILIYLAIRYIPEISFFKL